MRLTSPRPPTNAERGGQHLGWQTNPIWRVTQPVSFTEKSAATRLRICPRSLHAVLNTGMAYWILARPL